MTGLGPFHHVNEDMVGPAELQHSQELAQAERMTGLGPFHRANKDMIGLAELHHQYLSHQGGL